MIRLDRWQMDLIVAANPGVAISEKGVVARVVQTLCKRCRRLTPVGHDCCPPSPVDAAAVVALNRIRARTSAAPATTGGSC